ncbi:MAG: ABC transporter permease [Anaerolineae bacterium]|jgi:ABC-type multidrug transport system permease subunit|nr:ABC transporter permease [Anaerolineae bacterium]
MKLWHSFRKELLLASRSFYFYIEVGLAALMLFVLLFVIPENFETKTDEYLYYDVPEAAWTYFEEDLLSEDEDGVVALEEFDWNDETVEARLYETDSARYHVFDNEEAAIAIADKERAYAGSTYMNVEGEISYTFYIQGYETERVLNTIAVFHNEDLTVLGDVFDAQELRVLHEGQQDLLSDRQNMIPSFLTFNGSLMGLFFLASYIFLDKKEGVIKAYAVTTSPVWQYLLSKVLVVTTTSLVTSLIITIPVMGAQPNYLLMILFLVLTGFAASALGLIFASYYDDISQAFGVFFLLVVVMMLPNIAYFIPSWNPWWMRLIPSYYLMEGFKELILPGGEVGFVLVVSSVSLAIAILLFLLANHRFKKKLTV